MSLNDELHVAALLQRYCEDNCTAEERAYIERNPNLLRRAATMRREDAALQQLFSDATTTPSTTMVVDPPPSKLSASHAPSSRITPAISTSVMPPLFSDRPSTVKRNSVALSRENPIPVRG